MSSSSFVLMFPHGRPPSLPFVSISPTTTLAKQSRIVMSGLRGQHATVRVRLSALHCSLEMLAVQTRLLLIKAILQQRRRFL